MDKVKTFVQNISHATTSYISFLSYLYSVRFLCQFILEYIINCIGKGLQVLIC